MIKFEPISHGKIWSGSDWSITNEDELANLIARVALGQYRYVLKILKDTECEAYAPTSSALEGAIRLLTPTDDNKPWHRDGWLFQVISWIAANIQDPQTLKSPPQMIHADKGFDGLHLCLDDTRENVISIIVCEEKATTVPRNKITSQVWPEFKSLEAGSRDNELVSEATTLLAGNTHLNPDKAIHEIIWKKVRKYRVSITIGDNECTDDGRRNLFKGYKKIVSGEGVSRRRAETFYQSRLRDWMKQIANKAISAAKAMEAENV
ncbi:hypothetical protein MACH10_15920 [Thalassospira tepidiphila]|uniref:hypothetical protein n=1 Tax=Thalassospira tepidiphila TaxID=393657 RepID=UPI002920BAB7|nr:hypothetical protein MACH10_15920 [Thalassospira tepidiphila]